MEGQKWYDSTLEPNKMCNNTHKRLRILTEPEQSVGSCPMGDPMDTDTDSNSDTETETET